MAARGPLSLNWLREGGRRGRLTSNFGKKEAVRKNWNGGEKNIKERQTHGCRLLQASRREILQRQALYPLIDRGRATCAADWQAILEKGSCEKKSEWWGKKLNGEANLQQPPSAGKLQAGMAATCPWSLYWLREGGRRGQLKSNLIGKKKLLEKIGMVGKKQKGEANSPSLPSPWNSCARNGGNRI